MSFFIGKYINNSILGAEKTNPTSIMKIDKIAATSYIVQRNLFVIESPIHSLSVKDLPELPHVKGINFYRKLMLTD